MKIHIMFDPENGGDVDVNFDGVDSAQQMPVPIGEAIETFETAARAMKAVRDALRPATTRKAKR